MRKRYILFTYYSYYPEGGLDDIYGRYDTLAEIEEVVKALYTVQEESTSVRKAKRDKKSCKITSKHVQVGGPDYFEILDLDTGLEEFLQIEIPKSSTTEISVEWL